MIKKISLDLETYSDVDLSKSGIYRYAESENFEILLLSYSINDEEVKVIDIALNEPIPEELIDALISDDVIKWAFNASFERICLSNWIKNHYPNKLKSKFLNPKSWRCSMVWSAYMGLPLSLEGAGKILKLDEQKLKEGKDLIKYFCVPCKPTNTNKMRTRNLPHHDLSKWELFKKYNVRDVEVELSIQKRLSNFPVPDFIWDEYCIDQNINDRGILIDMELANSAINLDELSKTELTSALQKLTELDNPNSVMQMKKWLSDNGLETESLGKKVVTEMLKTAPPELCEVLLLRQQLAKSSVKKYQAMKDTVCKDGRAHGMFFFYGANRSGRWAGRHIQLQNLPQNHIDDLAEARSLVKNSNYDSLKMLYEDVPDTLSQLIRTAFIPKENHKFIVSDFSAIEARVLSHLANEKWRIKVFENGGDIYCASASEMFHVPVEKHGINAHLRQKGKIAELALGYGGSVGALKAMGALDMGLTEDELKPLVISWREANKKIVELWKNVDEAVINAIKLKTKQQTNGLTFTYKSGMLFITLPSKRNLCYVKPKIIINDFGLESVSYEGIGTAKKWERIESYGPKFVENIVQAISRDILAYAMRTLCDFDIVAHVHDELIIECPMDTEVDTICSCMGKTPEWISGLCLRADGYECEFYRKD